MTWHWPCLTLDSHEKFQIKLIPSNQEKAIPNSYSTHISNVNQKLANKFFTFINFLHHIFAEIIDWTWNSNRSLQFNFCLQNCTYTHDRNKWKQAKPAFVWTSHKFFFLIIFYMFFLLRVKKEKISFLYW